MQSTRLIWKELQPQLAKDHVKAACFERQIQGAAFNPINWRAVAWRGPGDCQHPLVQVQTSDAPLTHPPTCQAGNNPGSAGDVENVLFGTRLGSIHKIA